MTITNSLITPTPVVMLINVLFCIMLSNFIPLVSRQMNRGIQQAP